MLRKKNILGIFFIPLLYITYLLLFTGFFSKRNLYPFFKYEGKSKKRSVYFSHSKPSHWVSVKSVNPKIKWPIIISEDWAFFEHSGIDVNQIWKVVKESISEKKLTRGASTISQQLVKNIYLGQQRSIFRKFNEFILVFFLEATCSKKWILEQYLNIVELGKGIDGVSKGAKFYFGKNQSYLNFREGAFLAFLLPSPRKYSQSFFRKELSSYAQERIKITLEKLLVAKVITEEELLQELSSKFYWEGSN